jgi:hypothetical protein
MWIDEKTSTVRRAQIKFQIKYATDALYNPVPSSSPKAAFSAVVEYDGLGHYDQFNNTSIKIEPPKLAIPLSSHAQSKTMDKDIQAIADKADVDIC